MSVVPVGERKLDLYDFFSVLLPGAALLLALAPFLPKSINPASAGMVVILLLGSFIVGRGLHAVAVYLEDEWETIPTHRERFEDELDEPTALNEETISNFKQKCETVFGIDDFSQFLKGDDDSYSPGDLYVLTRSAVHLDGRGRSRTFQALYSFHRGMWLVTSGVGVIYYLYAVGKVLEIPGALAGYTSHIGAVQFEPVLIGIGGSVLFFAAHILFRRSRKDYQTVYIQYLIADFLVLQTADYPEAVVVAEEPES